MKNNLFLLIAIMSMVILSCSKNNYEDDVIDFRSGDLIGTWQDDRQIFIKDSEGKLDTLRDGRMTFYEDSTYSCDAILFWTLRGGDWDYDIETKTISFIEHSNVFQYDSIPLINEDDIKLNITWQVLNYDNSKLNIIEHVTRKEKIYTNFVTGLLDTIPKIDIINYRNIEKVK